MYADSNKGALPCDGPDGSDTSTNLIGPPNLVSPDPNSAKLTGMDDSSLWYNAIPVKVNNQTYYDQIENDLSYPGSLPHAGSSNIFICPSASDPVSLSSKDVITNGYFMLNCVDPAFSKTAKTTRKTYMSYAFNSKLFGTDAAGIVHAAWKLSQLHPSSDCVLMSEKLGSYGEYKDPKVQAMALQYPSDTGKNITTAGYTSNIGQLKTCWTRFAARHRHGGFILYADGHVGFHEWTEVQLQHPTATIPNANNPGIAIWNPAGPVN
jgi:prepilin-type processing-associated H-X9-DG protein